MPPAAWMRLWAVLAIALCACATWLAPATSAEDGPPGTTTPVESERAGDPWVQVSTGGGYSCGVRASHHLFCWGIDQNGTLGDGEPRASRSSPSEVVGPAAWAEVSAGLVHACGITTARRLFCWGANTKGQLGIGTTSSWEPTPVEVAGRWTNWASVSAGYTSTCGVTTTHRLYCWGYDRWGQLGNGTVRIRRERPTEVAGGSQDWRDVSAGYQHACARTVTRHLYCWGSDFAGQLGDGGELPGPIMATPTEVAGGDTDWGPVHVGFYHSCARKVDGRLMCWGDDGHDQLGDSGSGDQASPVDVPFPGADPGGWAFVDAGDVGTCAGGADHRLWCWGQSTGGPYPAPVEAPGSHDDWATVSSHGYHTCGLRSGQRLFCWGSDAHGQVGNGLPRANEPAPVRIP